VVSGCAFHAYCTEHIFAPLGMSDTSFRLSDLDSSRVALPYNSDGESYGHYSVKFSPATTLRSSIRDYSQLLMAFIQGGVAGGERILQENTVEIMFRPQYPQSQFGLIWFWFPDGWYGHGGFYMGVRTESQIHREDGLGFCIFSNGEDSSVLPGGLVFDLIKSEAENYR